MAEIDWPLRSQSSRSRCELLIRIRCVRNSLAPRCFHTSLARNIDVLRDCDRRWCRHAANHGCITIRAIVTPNTDITVKFAMPIRAVATTAVRTGLRT